MREPHPEAAAVLGALAVYYDDIVLLEPKLLDMYDRTRTEIDRALGDSR